MTTDFQTFDITRTFRAPIARVFAAWAQTEAKRRWFAWDNPPDWRTEGWSIDFRPGGTERGVFMRNGTERFVYAATYLDIVRDARIVYAYTMARDAALLSASLSTVTLAATDGGARLAYTEQAVFLDGGDRLATRLEGTEWLLDRLAGALDETAEASHA